MSVDYNLYLVTDSGQAGGAEHVPGVVEQAIAGGVSVVQVRDKHATDEDFEKLLLAVGEVAAPHSVPVFANDRVEIAARHGFHAHIGQDDLPLAEARRLLGPEALIGLSVGTDTELDEVLAQDVRPDVIGVGPVYPTGTKADAGEAIGTDGLTHLAARAAERGIAAVAIGGISAERVAEVRATPVAGVCVVSAIMTAADPRAAAAALAGGGAR